MPEHEARLPWHVDVLNILSSLARVLRSLQEVNDDQIRRVRAVKTLEEEETQEAAALDRTAPFYTLRASMYVAKQHGGDSGVGPNAAPTVLPVTTKKIGTEDKS